MIYRNDDPCALSYRDSYIMSDDDDYDGYFEEEEDEDDEELFICSHCGMAIDDDDNFGYSDVPLCDECAYQLQYFKENGISLDDLVLILNDALTDEETRKYKEWLNHYAAKNQINNNDLLWSCWTKADIISEQIKGCR